MNKFIVSVLIIIIFVYYGYSNVKPNFQLTGNQRNPIVPENVQVLMTFPDDVNSYEIIGLMSDCSSTSEYSEFIAVFKKTAAKYGANCIVVSKSAGTNSSYNMNGLCVEASAIYLKPKTIQKQLSQSDCVNELREIIKYQKIIDSLKTELENCRKQ